MLQFDKHFKQKTMVRRVINATDNKTFGWPQQINLNLVIEKKTFRADSAEINKWDGTYLISNFIDSIQRKRSVLFLHKTPNIFIDR